MADDGKINFIGEIDLPKFNVVINHCAGNLCEANACTKTKCDICFRHFDKTVKMTVGKKDEV